MSINLTGVLETPLSNDKESTKKRKGRSITKENERLKAIYDKYKLKSDQISNEMLQLFANQEKLLAEEDFESSNPFKKPSNQTTATFNTKEASP